MNPHAPTAADIINAYRDDAREREELLRVVERENRGLRREVAGYRSRPARRELLAFLFGIPAGIFAGLACVAWQAPNGAYSPWGWLFAAAALLTGLLWRELRRVPQ